MTATIEIRAPSEQTEGTRSQVQRWLKSVGDAVVEPAGGRGRAATHGREGDGHRPAEARGLRVAGTSLDEQSLIGQVALAIDHFGWLGVERSPVTAVRLSGVVLLGVGTWLVIRD